MLHILPRGFVKIRHYGLMASSNVITRLETARRLLEEQNGGKMPSITSPETATTDSRANSEKGADGSSTSNQEGVVCPRCKEGHLVRYLLAPWYNLS